MANNNRTRKQRRGGKRRGAGKPKTRARKMAEYIQSLPKMMSIQPVKLNNTTVGTVVTSVQMERALLLPHARQLAKKVAARK